MASFGSAELSLITGLLLAGVSVYLFISAMFGANNDKEVLARASGDERPKSKSAIINISRPLVDQFTLKYALKIKSESYRKRIKKLLLTSGMSRELTVDEFIGLQFFWGVMFPAFMLIMNFALELEIPYFLIIPLFPFGFYMPQLHAGGMKSQRLIDVQVNLPFFIDLLALSTEAGLDFIGAIQRIVDKSEENVLSEELQIVLKDIKLGSSRLEALRQMAIRLDIPEITSFIAVLADADATGASIAQVLKDQSVQMRLERFVRAEKAGARASQTILIPMMVFILPAVFVMVFGPVALQFISGQGGP